MILPFISVERSKPFFTLLWNTPHHPAIGANPRVCPLVGFANSPESKKQNIFLPGAHCAPLRCGKRCCRSGKWLVDPVPTGRNGQDHSLRLPGTFCTIPPLRRRGRPMCLPAGRLCEFTGKQKTEHFPAGRTLCAPTVWETVLQEWKMVGRPSTYRAEWSRPFPTPPWDVLHHVRPYGVGR